MANTNTGFIAIVASQEPEFFTIIYMYDIVKMLHVAHSNAKNFDCGNFSGDNDDDDDRWTELITSPLLHMHVQGNYGMYMTPLSNH